MLEGYFFDTEVTKDSTSQTIGSFVTTDNETAKFSTTVVTDQADPAIIKNLKETEKAQQSFVADSLITDLGELGGSSPETQGPVKIEQTETTSGGQKKSFFTLTNILLAVIAIILIIKIFKK